MRRARCCSRRPGPEYESADEACSVESNRLTPRRRPGSIARLFIHGCRDGSRADRSPLPPDRRLAAAAHAAASGPAGAAALGSARSPNAAATPGAKCATSSAATRPNSRSGITRSSSPSCRTCSVSCTARPPARNPRSAGDQASMRVFRRDDVAARAHHLSSRASRRSLFRRGAHRPVLLPRRGHRDPRLRDVRGRHSARSRAGHAVPLRPRLSRVLGARRLTAAIARTRSSGWMRTARCSPLRISRRAPNTCRSPRAIARRASRNHWEYLLQPAGARVSRADRDAALPPARVLPHAVHVLSRAWTIPRSSRARTSCASASSRGPGEPDTLPYSPVHARRLRARVLRRSFLGPQRRALLRATRASSSRARRSRVVGRHDDYFFSGPVTGLLEPVPPPVLPAVPDRAFPQGRAAVDVR